MDLTPEELELVEFTVLGDGGFDADEVRELLGRVAEQMRAIERDATRVVSESVRDLLDQAIKSGDEIVAKANSGADAIRRAAESNSVEIAAEVERSARERSVEVIAEAQHRLDRLLAAERDVHDRLAATLIEINESLGRAGVNQVGERALTVDDSALVLET